MTGIVLVTGAAGGKQGATGRLVTELLLTRGEAVGDSAEGRNVTVRAFVRKMDERAERLQELGAEIAVGDLREIADVQKALVDVDQVFFTYPVVDGLLDATAVMAAAARRAGVRRLVEVSQLRPRIEAHSPRTRQHWVSEQVFDHADIGAIHLRATVFYENLRALALVGAPNGELAVPLGPADNKLPLVAGSDVARVAAALLAEPDKPAEPFYRLIGAVLSNAEIVAEFADALDTPLTYVNIDNEKWADQARARGAEEHTVRHLSKLWQIFSNPAHRQDATFEVTPAIEEVTGVRPETLGEFLSKNLR